MKYLPMKKIEVDFRLDEPPIVWDPQDAFIENLSTKIYYAVPAFIGGVIVGTILWAFYILLYKTGNCVKNHAFSNTGKSFSEALILESVNPQYDERLFIEFPEKYKFTTCCVQILF